MAGQGGLLVGDHQGRHNMLVLASWILVSVKVQTPTPASSDSSCRWNADSIEALAPAGRADLVPLARRLLRSCSDDFDALYRAGRAIGRAAPDSRWHFSPQLDQAERLLARSVVLRPEHSLASLEYGLVLEKMGGVEIDAQRAVQRAILSASPDSASAPLVAEMHTERGRYLQSWLDRFRWLRDASRLPVSTPACRELGAFCENFVHPRRFNDQLRDAAPISPDVSSRRAEILEHYEAALRLDVQNIEAADGLARELALSPEWEPLVERSRTIARTQSRSFFDAVAALSLFQMGRFDAADSSFKLAIARMPDSLKRWYESPPPGLDSVSDFWARARPLWTIGYNEPQLEYWARVTYALLVFGKRVEGVLGPETAQGDALIRYGWPMMITEFSRDMRKFDARDQSDGLWVIWTYNLNAPSYIFELPPGKRVLRYMRESQAEATADRARKQVPFAVTPRVAFRAFQLPVQVARFRGSNANESEVLWYGVAPNEQMGVPAQSPEAIGVFVFRDTVGLPLRVENRSAAQAGVSLAVDFGTRLAAGRYLYSFEVLARSSGTAATARDTLSTRVWPSDSLSMSDLLVGLDAQPTDSAAAWRDLRVVPSRTLTLVAGSQVWVVWEAYGLSPDTVGNARFSVRLTLRDANRRSFPVRVLRGLGLLGRSGETAASLQWEGYRPPALDGRMVDYVALQLPERATGAFEVSVTVRDSRSGQETTAVKRLTILEPQRPN